MHCNMQYAFNMHVYAYKIPIQYSPNTYSTISKFVLLFIIVGLFFVNSFVNLLTLIVKHLFCCLIFFLLFYYHLLFININ